MGLVMNVLVPCLTCIDMITLHLGLAYVCWATQQFALQNVYYIVLAHGSGSTIGYFSPQIVLHLRCLPLHSSRQSPWTP